MSKKKIIEYKVLKPVDAETIKKFKSMKQDFNEMKIIKDDIMRLEIGVGLIPLIDEDLEDNLQKRISSIRKEIEREIGISIPKIRVRDNLSLKEFEYSFYICGKEMVKYEIEYNKYLCIDPGNVKNKINGKNIKDPVFGLPTILINKEQIESALDAGYYVADAQCIISTSLSCFIKEKLFEIFSYDDSKNILEKISESNPLLIYDCYSKYKHIEIKRILSKILEKKIKLLNNIVKIIELLIFYVDKKDDIKKITELIIKELPLSLTPTTFEVIEGKDKTWEQEAKKMFSKSKYGDGVIEVVNEQTQLSTFIGFIGKLDNFGKVVEGSCYRVLGRRESGYFDQGAKKLFIGDLQNIKNFEKNEEGCYAFNFFNNWRKIKLDKLKSKSVSSKCKVSDGELEYEFIDEIAAKWFISYMKGSGYNFDFVKENISHSQTINPKSKER
ncbi:MAG: flagellar biosynthesis protein FlhA [Spirochaetaceae bacterium]|nr:flagellar biosynthesis protein FlhA [Spirochaetaceae bacterium]